MTHYRGWRYGYDHARPITGRWRALRYGVSMCAGLEESLKRMIDNKCEEERMERAEREAAKRERP